MDKITYLAELAEGLARWVPERERQDILRYYAEYFEEAGPGREAEVVQELGDPWALSCRLAVEGGFATQQQAESWTPPRKKKWPWLAAAGVAAAVLLFTVVSVAIGAATFGRIVGRNVAGLVDQVAVAKDPAATGEATFYEYGYGSVPVPSVPPVAVVEDVQVWAGTESAFGFWTREDGCLDTFDSVDVDISFGNVTIHGGEDYTLAIQKEGDLGDYELKWAVQDGRLTVQDARPGGFQSNWGAMVGQHSLDVIVTVPEGCGLEELGAKTAVGNVFLGSLEVAKPLAAEADVGNVECYEIGGTKKITLKSDVGDVTLGMDELRQGMTLDLKANVGDVEANLNAREKEFSYELKCGVGTVSVNGSDQGDRSERENDGLYHLDAQSNVGDVNVFFPDDRW